MKTGLLGAISLALLALLPHASLAKGKAPTKVTNAKSMTGMTNVVVSSFAIAFVTEKTDGAFAGSRRTGKAMGIISKARLEGVSSVDFQAVTDAAYADFAERLRAAGYVVGDRAAMLAAKEMAKVQYVPSGTPGTLTFGKDSKAKAVFYGPTAFGATPLLKGETGEANVPALGGMFGALKAFSAFGGPAMSKTMYAMQNGQPTVSVLYVIDFADAEKYGSSFTTIATVDTKASLAVVETLSTVNTINAKGAAGAIVVAQPVAVPGAFGTMRDSSTTGQRLDNVAGAVIGGLFGSGSNKYQHIVFTADPPAYRSGAIQASTATNAIVIAQLAANR